MNKQNKLLLFVCIMCIISIVSMFVLLSNQNKQPEFIPPSFDALAQNGTPKIQGQFGYQVLDAQVFLVGLCGELIVNDNVVDVWFTNPKSNDIWMKLRMHDSLGNILGETGLIRPGEYVQSLILDELPQPESSVVIKVMAYEPDTYYSAGSVSINTNWH